MDNPTRWNITNSAQNIVSALVDPSKQFDHVFKREWSNTFSGFSRHKPSAARLASKQDADIRSKLCEYIRRLEERRQTKAIEAKNEVKASESTRVVEGESDIRFLVPDVFYMENFDLSKVEVFNRVVDFVHYNPVANSTSTKADSRLNVDHDDEIGDVYNGSLGYVKSDAGKKTKVLSKKQLKELQQKFTDYLDLIEEKLASRISNRSGDFFQVMSSVDSVMDELSLAIKSVTSLRRKFSVLNEDLISPNMKNIQLSRARNRAQAVLDMMKEISHLCKVQPMIQLLLSTSDFNGARDLIDKTRVTLHKDFTRVVCLRHLESQLLEIERVIGAMMQQEYVYVYKFHDERKKRIDNQLEKEQWKMVEEVPNEFQKLITMLIDENMSINETLSILEQQNPQCSFLRASEKFGGGHSRGASDSSANINFNQSESKKSSEMIRKSDDIQDQQLLQQGGRTPAVNSNCRLSFVSALGSTYVIVNSVIELIGIVIEYCRCAIDLKSLSAEILEHLFEILQLYNSKAFHLVYSAGAIEIAGLKTITPRNLIVSQRCLKLIILLIPIIHKFFQQLLPENTRLRHFDEIKSSYEDHAGKIPERVIFIVKDVINTELIPWEAKPPVPSAQFSKVAKILRRLHDTTQGALPACEFRSLFMRIDQTFKDVLVLHLRRLGIGNDAGPQQWLVTQELTFYQIELAKLSVFKGLELNYDEIWSKLDSSDDVAESDSSAIYNHDNNTTGGSGNQRREQSQQT